MAKEWNIYKILCNRIFITAKKWKQPKRLWTDYDKENVFIHTLE